MPPGTPESALPANTVGASTTSTVRISERFAICLGAVKTLVDAKRVGDDEAVLSTRAGGKGGDGSDREMSGRTAGRRSPKIKGMAMMTQTAKVCAVSDAASAPVFLGT